MARRFNLLSILSILVIMTPDIAMARGKGTYFGDGCIVYVPSSSSYYDKFFYCTNNASKSSNCSGVKNNHNDRSTHIRHGEATKCNTDQYTTRCQQHYCCIKPGETNGVFVRNDSATFYKQDANKIDIIEEREKTLENGATCRQQYKYSVCDNFTEPVLVQDCFKADSCQSGYVLRPQLNQDAPANCAQPCSGDQVFAGPDSNNCISCPESPYQGIVYPNPENPTDFTDTINLLGYCVKCDPDKSFFDRDTKSCKPKGDFIRRGNDAIKACWKCIAKGTVTDENSLTHFEECLKQPDSARESYVESNCKVK